MYICICNALTDREVREAARAGAQSPAAVYKHFGCRPQCGKCKSSICEILEAHRAASGESVVSPGELVPA